jgi:DNA-binding CsgD family transcriptional regulator
VNLGECGSAQAIRPHGQSQVGAGGRANTPRESSRTPVGPALCQPTQFYVWTPLLFPKNLVQEASDKGGHDARRTIRASFSSRVAPCALVLRWQPWYPMSLSQKRLVALTRECLSHIRENPEGHVAPTLVKLLAEGLSAQVVAHRPERLADRWGSEQMIPSDHPTSRNLAQRTVAFLTRAPLRYTYFDPLHVIPSFANTVYGPAALQKLFRSAPAPIILEVYVAAGILDLSHMRLLSADGTFMLQWLGLFREEPFTKGEETLLASLAPALASRLIVERVLWSGSPGSFESLAQVLELVGGPAFVVAGGTKGGRIVLLNSAGQTVLAEEPSLTSTIVGAARGVRSSRVRSVTAIGAPGVSRHHVVVIGDTRTNVDARLRLAVRDVGLTQTEANVLACVVRGDPNKDIATKLGCSARTVEVHVANILDKTRVESRARLIAWFWTR